MWPCVIEKADFDEDIVTLKMQSSDYTVGVGLHWLSTAHPQPKAEPVIDKSAAIRIATALGWAPKREWVGLTDLEKAEIYHNQKFVLGFYTPSKFADAIEARLKEQNT